MFQPPCRFLDAKTGCLQYACVTGSCRILPGAASNDATDLWTYERIAWGWPAPTHLHKTAGILRPGREVSTDGLTPPHRSDVKSL